MPEKLKNLQKKLIYRSSHRGTKELDILFGNFVKENITIFSEENLLELINLTDCNDHDLWSIFNSNTTQNTIKISNDLESKIKQYQRYKNGH